MIRYVLHVFAKLSEASRLPAGSLSDCAELGLCFWRSGKHSAHIQTARHRMTQHRLASRCHDKVRIRAATKAEREPPRRCVVGDPCDLIAFALRLLCACLGRKRPATVLGGVCRSKCGGHFRPSSAVGPIYHEHGPETNSSGRSRQDSRIRDEPNRHCRRLFDGCTQPHAKSAARS